MLGVDARRAMARDRTLAAAFIRNADPTRDGTLTAELSNIYARGKDEYPTDLTSACGMLVNYTMPANARARHYNAPSTIRAQNSESSAMTLAQRDTIPGTNGITHKGITCYNCNSEFEYLRESLRPIALNVVTTDSLVGKAERSIHTIKERLRACVHGLPYKHLTRLMITHLVSDAVHQLNQFPRKHGVSDTLSPTCILTGAPLPDYNALALEFDSYVQVFKDSLLSNTPRA
jgi:hypothetical protein